MPINYNEKSFSVKNISQFSSILSSSNSIRCSFYLVDFWISLKTGAFSMCWRKQLFLLLDTGPFSFSIQQRLGKNHERKLFKMDQFTETRNFENCAQQQKTTWVVYTMSKIYPFHAHVRQNFAQIERNLTNRLILIF